MAYAIMASLTVVGMIAVLVRPEPPKRVGSDTREREQRVERFLLNTRLRRAWLRRLGAWFTGAVVCPFVDFFARNGRSALLLLALVALYKVSDLAMAAMAYPLYIDLGFDKTTIANITKFLGLAVTVIGGMVGGLLTARYGIARMLILGAIIIPVANLVFALLAAVGDELPMLVATIVADNLSNGVASAVFIAFLSSLTSRAYTATQYALFSSLMTLPGKFLGGFSGFVVEWQGYPFFFITAAAMGIPAIILAIRVARTGAGIQEHPDAPDPA
jgi:PAT family beta-lactamase induction signal transducer AmpG